ncbi:hypothetical protein [Streptomyces ossamyceticus]|jgi:hypothetical protein|uniref:hypothetical protein n=1 Tax=Streptomyces ossamyceticus TaxID=249581 RepID=UPI0034490B16
MANPNQDARSGHGQYIRTPETAQRDAQAAELRAQGWTLQAIAEHLGFHDRSGARLAIRRALTDIVKGPAEKLLAIHMERLETLYEAAMEVMEADHVVVSHGQIVKGEDGQPLKDSGPKLAAIREARSTLDAFWNLAGMKKPAKVEHSGGVKYEIVGVNPEDVA